MNDVEFVLTDTPFALGAFDGNAGKLEMLSHRRGVVLVPRSLEDVIILRIPAGTFQTCVVFQGSVAIAVLKKVVLQFLGKDA